MNIKDIAKIAGVSKTTVSRVLNNSTEVSENAKTKILSIIDQYDFLPNYLARSLKIKNTKTIGVVVPDIGNPFYFEIIRGIENLLDKNGFSIMLCNSSYNEEKELKYIHLLASKKVDGIILAFLSENSKSLKKIINWKIPYVCFDLPQFENIDNSVSIDHSLCSYIATKHFIENGHTNILVVDIHRQTKDYSGYIKGYIKALNENGISFNKDLVQETTADILGGYNVLKKMLQNNIKFTGILTISDLIAVGVYRAANKYGLKIPDDISVIGNDDIPLARSLCPPLTTIQQPKFLIGYKSAELLLNKINENSEKTKDHSSLVLNIKLVKRNSVKRRDTNGNGIH